MGFVRGIHDAATAIWAGGLYLLLFVILPVARREGAMKLALAIQARLRWFVVAAVPVLVATGILEARARKTLLTAEVIPTGPYRTIFVAKIALVVAMGIVALVRQRMLFRRADGIDSAATMKAGLALLVANVVLATVVLVLSGMLTSTGQMLLLRFAG
jgi:putative copper export protein